MSTKRSRRSLLLRRAGAGLLVGGLAATLVIVYVDRSDRHTETVSATSASSAPIGLGTTAALAGTYDVTLTVVSADYGVTWPGVRLTNGQHVTQRWNITCRATTCEVAISSGHVVEDPDGATVATDDDKDFTVSATTPASPDAASTPPGCGTVNATDVQKLTLVLSTGAFSGHYSVHHPVTHVEGPVGDRVGSCDSFNAELDVSAHRV